MGLSEPPVQDGKQGEAGRSAQAPEHTLRRGILERDGGDQQRMGRTRLWQRRGASDAVLIVVSRRPVPTCATRPPMPTTSIASAVVVPNPAKSTITSKLTPSNSLMLFVRPAGVLHVRPLATTARGPAAARDERPEAEWGFEPALRADVEAFAQQRGYHYRGWYARLGRRSNRLLVESFVVMGPFWLLFNMEPSAAAVEHYPARSSRRSMS
jgi:hypothetical protein